MGRNLQPAIYGGLGEKAGTNQHIGIGGVGAGSDGGDNYRATIEADMTTMNRQFVALWLGNGSEFFFYRGQREAILRP